MTGKQGLNGTFCVVSFRCSFGSMGEYLMPSDLSNLSTTTLRLSYMIPHVAIR